MSITKSFVTGSKRRQRRTIAPAARGACEQLERRLMLANDPATIVWTNRATTTSGGSGDTDHFGAIFGTLAPTARAVVDTVIAQYEGMIGSFNYSSSGHEFHVSISMSSTDGGFGAAASLDDDLDGKPDAGTVVIDFGQLTPDPNDSNGWFIDPTPSDSSEFMGTIVNAFAGNAQSGSPAAGKSDFYSFVAAEMEHCLGQFGDKLDGWANLTTDTGVPDQVLSPGDLWVFRGPDIKHLMTSDNASHDDLGAAVHTAEPQTLVFQGNTYVGTQDSGNAQTGNGQRTLIDNIHALMFKDAYGYSTVNPASQGTFYSVLDTTKKLLTVRGGDFSGQSPSDDVVDIFRTGNILTVSVDVGLDIPGSGALSGPGNLPAFATRYDISQVSSIIVDTGDGDDVIQIDSLPPNMPTTIMAGDGNDTIDIGDGDVDTNILSSITVSAQSGNDQLNINDSQDTGSNGYQLNDYQFTKDGANIISFDGNLEALNITGSPGNNTVSISGTPAFTAVTFDGRAGNDGVYIGNGDISTILGPVSIIGGDGTDSINIVDDSSAVGHGFTVTNTSITAGNMIVDYGSSTESIVINGSPNADSFEVDTSGASPAMTLNGNGGNDGFGISPAGYTSTSSGGGAIQINGGAGTDRVVVIDEPSFPTNITITNSTFSRTYSPTYNYATVESLSWIGGPSDETFQVESTQASTPVSLYGQGGNDTFENGYSTDHELFFINGALTIDGGTGTNTLIANDLETPISHVYTVGANTFSHDTSATITYTNIATATLLAGFSSDTINITGTTPGTNLIVNSEQGDDTVNVNATASGSGVGTYVTLDGATSIARFASGDTINVNADGLGTAAAHFAASQSPAAVNILAGGTLVMEAAGNRLLSTKSLSVASKASLDLNDNDMIVDYTGATKLPTVSGWIATARGTGAWTGSGITSSMAKNNAKHITTLGAIEATDYKSIYGNNATFDGATVDNTAVLVKYTYYGDANFSGTVDGGDYARMDLTFAKEATQGNIGGWFNGDFDGDGRVNGSDYALADLAFGNQTTVFWPALPPARAGSGLGSLRS